MSSKELTVWPPNDAERRRVADLRAFFRENPEAFYKLSKEDQEECRQYLPQGDQVKTGGKAFHRAGPAALKTGRKRPHFVKWKLDTTLALVREMKRFALDKKVGYIGVSQERWITISTALSKPCGLEQEVFAQSCRIRYENLRRDIREGKPELVQEEVRVALNDFWNTCKTYANSQRRLAHLTQLCASSRPSSGGGDAKVTE